MYTFTKLNEKCIPNWCKINVTALILVSPGCSGPVRKVWLTVVSAFISDVVTQLPHAAFATSASSELLEL